MTYRAYSGNVFVANPVDVPSFYENINVEKTVNVFANNNAVA